MPDNRNRSQPIQIKFFFSRLSDVQLHRSAADFSEIVPGVGAFPSTRLHGCINASIACQVRFAVGR